MADGSDDDLIDNEVGEDEEKFSRRKERKFQDSSEEDEDENQDEFEKDDFIVDGDDDVDEDGDGSRDSDEVGRRRRERKEKRKRRRNVDVDDEDDELHEDDIRMLREQGVEVDLKRRKKLRRLKKHAAADDEDEDDFRDFGDDAPQADYDREREAVDEDVDDVEDDDDFIDDGGRSRRRSKKAGTGGVNSEAVRAARNVFGDYSAIRAEFKATGRGARSGPSRESEDNSDGDGEVTDPLDDGRRKSARRKRKGSDSDSDGSADLDDDDESASGKSDSDQETRHRSRKRPGQKPSRAGAQTTTDVSATADALGSGLMLSADDTALIDTDVPERLQEHFGKRGAVEKEELTAEAKWIYARAFAVDDVYARCFDASLVEQKIGIVLNYMHEEKLDIPFIAQYRRDYIAPELLYPCGGSPLEPSPPGYPQMPPKHPIGFNAVNYADYDEAFSIDHLRGVDPGYDDGFGDWTSLWKVLDWDKKWADMTAMRGDTLRLIETCRSKGVPEDVTRIAQDLAKECQDYNELLDIERHIRLATEAAVALSGRNDSEDSSRVDLDAISEAEKQVANRRRPNSRSNRYTEYLRKGYAFLATKFGIVASELAVNLEGAAQYGDQYQECVPRDAEAVPMDMSEMVQKDLEDALNASERSGEVDTLIERDPAKLLACARHLLAQEVLADPRVLRTARKTLRISEAKVTTEVTDSGSIAVGDSHPLRAYVNVQKKPVALLKGTSEYALMKRAAEKGYCSVQVVFDVERETALLNSITFAATDGGETSSELVKAWNEERRELAKEVCAGLIGRLKSEVDQDLSVATEECLHERLSHAASRRLLLGPSRPFENETGAPRVMAICVTREGDEEPDPAQTNRDNDVGKDKSGVRPYRRPAGPRITFVNLDRNGIFLNSEEVFGKWLERPAHVKDPPEAIALRLEAFIRKSKPQVIVVGIGSGGREAVRLRGDILEILAKMATKKKDLGFLVGDALAVTLGKDPGMFEYISLEDEREGKQLKGWAVLRKHVFSVPDDVARLHALSNAANVALPVDGMTLLEKRAIALGRFAQYPLSVYAGIAVEKDMLARLEMHRLHYMAKPEGRIEAFRRALTRSICIMGVDLNRILIVPHFQPMLTFIGGLGPLKAGALVRKIEVHLGDEEEGMEALASRKELIASDFLSRRVFMSAVGFLRIRDPIIHVGGSTTKACEVRRAQVNRKNRGGRRGRKDDDDELTFYDPLDDSRIHPENYNVAVKIADEALRDDNGNLRANLIDESASNLSKRVVAVVLDNPAGLDHLDLDLYASELDRMGRGLLSETIKMVASEFHAPFRDNRVPLSTPEPRGEFYLATGADPLELRLGGEVTATSCLVGRSKKGISCRLPYGLRGFVTIAQYSDDPVTGDQLEKMVSNGSDLRCRIIGFKYEAFEIGLASKISVMTNPQDYIENYKPSYDAESPYILHFSPKRRVERGSKEVRAGAVRAARLKTRAQGVVSHDFFHDVTADDAVAHLRNASVGEVIIRPSGRGLDLFAFTAKFADAARFPDNDAKRGIFHLSFEVVNSGEANVKYVIGKEEFGSVEEMLERHVICVLVNMGEAMEFSKFKNMKEDGMKKEVLRLKSEHPKRIPYLFGIAEKPLTLNLYYIPGSKTTIVEPIKVVPDGFQFRKILHTSLLLLANWFKKNMSQAPRAVAASNKVTASPFLAQAGGARTGMRSGAIPAGHVATPLRDEPPPQAPMGAGREPLPTAVSAAAYQSIPEPPPPRVTAPQIPDPPAKNPVSYLSQQNKAPHPPAQASMHGNPYGSGPGIGPGGFGGPPPAQSWGSAPPQHWGGAPPQAAHGAYPPPPPHGVPPPAAYNQYSAQAPQHGPPSHQRAPPPPPRAAHRPADPAAARRGQMPVPAWKKAEQGGSG